MVEEWGTWLIESEAMPDAVHMSVETDPQFGVRKLVKCIKATSSRVLGEEFPWLKSRLPSLRTNLYSVATVGGARFSQTKCFVELQQGC